MQKKILITLNILTIAILAGWGIFQSQKLVTHTDFKKCNDQYTFLSPDINCDTIDDSISQTKEIANKIEDFINLEKQTGKADQIAVFYRNLSTKQWFGVNENQQFYPASLAKLPTAMMYYKVAEVDKEILETPNTITAEDTQLNDGQNYKPPEKLGAGQDYPTKELVRRILTYSDNAPLRILMENALPFSAPVFLDLGITFPTKEGDTIGQWNITAKTVSNLFRVLYNSSYIRPEYSNIILDELTASNFSTGLVAGIPEETKVAHKFGEASGTDEKTNEVYIVLNDCGIVYKENSPYILCVMTQGKEFEDLETIIRTISEKVYKSI